MLTFYFIGVVIALMILLSFFAWSLTYEEEYEIDIVVYMVGMLLLSLFSWAIIFIAAMMFVFEWTKKD